MATVLRQIRHTELMADYPLVSAYYARALARPAWGRALQAYADRFGVPVTQVS